MYWILFFTISVAPLIVFAEAAKSELPTLNFSDRICLLKSQEKWREIVTLGDLLLAQPERSLRDRASIASELASCSFYLGDYDRVKYYASLCYGMASEILSTTLQIQSLYKLSAVYRAKKNLKKAREYYEEALTLVNICDNIGTIGKAYYNAAAAEADLEGGNSNKAKKFYMKASQYFPKESDDHARTIIRLTKLMSLTEEAKQAYDILKIYPIERFSMKTQGHYYFVKAQIECSLGYLSEAIKTAQKGLAITPLELKKDRSRLQQLLTSLNQ